LWKTFENSVFSRDRENGVCGKVIKKCGKVAYLMWKKFFDFLSFPHFFHIVRVSFPHFFHKNALIFPHVEKMWKSDPFCVEKFHFSVENCFGVWKTMWKNAPFMWKSAHFYVENFVNFL